MAYAAESGTKVKALERRLRADQLTPEDKDRFEMVKKIRAGRKAGMTIEQCAQVVGKKPRMVEQFIYRGVYKLFSAHLDRLESGDEEQAAAKIIRAAKTKFAHFTPDAIDYIRSCFMKDEDGKWLDDAKAMWATEKVMKGTGLTEPEHVVRPNITIQIAHIRHETAAVAADDAEAEAAVIEVTPTEALPRITSSNVTSPSSGRSGAGSGETAGESAAPESNFP